MADFADAFAAFLKDGPTDSDGENNRSDYIMYFVLIYYVYYKYIVQEIGTLAWCSLTKLNKKKGCK